MKKYWSSGDQYQAVLSRIQAEMEILKRLSHPYVILLKEIMDPAIEEFEHRIYFVLEYCP